MVDPGDPERKKSFVRAKRWSFEVDSGKRCHGQYIRWVCNIGLGDLKWVTASPHMFVNKIRIEQDSTAFRCLELWYRDRVRRRRHLANGNDTFNVSFYSSQPFVRYHVSKLNPNHQTVKPYLKFARLSIQQKIVDNIRPQQQGLTI